MKLQKSKTKTNKPVVMTELTKHPREFIEEVLRVSIYQQYGKEHLVNISHASKAAGLGNQKYIDYVFPCFELAHNLSESPSEVAKHIAEKIDKWLKKAHPKMQENLLVEPVNGYINFELSDLFLAEAAYFVAHWLQKPQTRTQKQKTARCLVLGPYLQKQVNHLHAETIYQYIYDMYLVAGYRITGHYLLPDASENSAENAALLVYSRSGTLSLSEYQKIRSKDARIAQNERTVKRILSGLKNDNFDKIQGSLLAIRKKYLNDAKHVLALNNIDLEIEQESQINIKVNNWLDSMKDSLLQGSFINDDRSQAVYYHVDTGPMSSLRTSSGILLGSAYLLYKTSELLRDTAKKDSTDSIIIIAPQKYHQLLYSYSSHIIPGSAYKSFICVDPTVAYSTLAHQDKPPESLKLALTKIAHTLGAAVSKRDHLSNEKRRKLLTLIDVPIDLKDLVYNTRPLELVTLMQSSISAAEELEA